jgi:hypothetical protein
MEVLPRKKVENLTNRYGVHGVSGVPGVALNETVEFLGAQPEARFLEPVRKAAA